MTLTQHTSAKKSMPRPPQTHRNTPTPNYERMYRQLKKQTIEDGQTIANLMAEVKRLEGIIDNHTRVLDHVQEMMEKQH